MSWIVLFYTRIVISVLAFAAGVCIAWKYWNKVGLKAFLFYYLVRLVSTFFLFERLGLVPSDVKIWGDDYATKILAGQIPGIDFLTFYFAGFHYVTTLAYWFLSYTGIAIVFMAAEMLALFFLYKMLAQLFSVEVAKKSLILYLFSPFAIIVSFMSGQDEPLMMLAMCSFAYFTLCRDSWIARIVSGFLSIALTKMTIVFYLLPMTVLRRYRGVLLFVMLYALYSVGMFLFGINPFNLKVESGGTVASRMLLGNFWSLFPCDVPDNVQLGVFLVLVGGWALSLMSNFFGTSSVKRNQFQSVLILSIGIELIFSLTYHTVYNAYVLPAALFGCCLLGMAKPSIFGFGLAFAWSVTACFKDPFMYSVEKFHIGNAALAMDFVSILYIVLTVLVLLSVLVFFRTLFHGPIDGFKALLCRD